MFRHLAQNSRRSLEQHDEKSAKEKMIFQRILATASTLIVLSLTRSVTAQAFPSGRHQGGDIAATYQWVHTNAQPAHCGCFSLNGVGISGSVDLISKLSAVAEVSGQFAKESAPLSSSLTLMSYLAGARYSLPRFPAGKVQLQPFAQALIGTAHAGGGIAGAGDGTYSFAARIGGGLDLPLRKQLHARVQVDYSSTEFANGANQQQNDLLLGVGVAYRWDRKK